MQVRVISQTSLLVESYPSSAQETISIFQAPLTRLIHFGMMKNAFLIKFIMLIRNTPVSYGWRIHQLHLSRGVVLHSNECPRYETKPSESEAPVPELWGFFFGNSLWKESDFVEVFLRVFTNGLGDLSSIPGRVIPKTQKIVLDASLLNTQHYKVRIKGKVEQSRERSNAFPIEKGAFESPSITVTNLLYFLLRNSL